MNPAHPFPSVYGQRVPSQFNCTRQNPVNPNLNYPQNSVDLFINSQQNPDNPNMNLPSNQIVPNLNFSQIQVDRNMNFQQNMTNQNAFIQQLNCSYILIQPSDHSYSSPPPQGLKLNIHLTVQSKEKNSEIASQTILIDAIWNAD
jgi:hypothetical protein